MLSDLSLPCVQNAINDVTATHYYLSSGRLQEVENKKNPKLSAIIVVAVAYERFQP